MNASRILKIGISFRSKHKFTLTNLNCVQPSIHIECNHTPRLLNTPLNLSLGNLLEIGKSPIIKSTIQFRLKYSASSNLHNNSRIFRPRNAYSDWQYLRILFICNKANKWDYKQSQHCNYDCEYENCLQSDFWLWLNLAIARLGCDEWLSLDYLCLSHFLHSMRISIWIISAIYCP